jgi:MATE family multidrug resistance protein
VETFGRAVDDGGRRGEFRATLALALPVVAAELGWIAMGVADLVMVGRLGPSAIGAVGIGNVLFFCVTVLGLGMMLGLDALVSQAFGAGRLGECHRWLVHGVVMALILTPPLTGAILAMIPWLSAWGIDPAVVARAGPYLQTSAWGLLPLLLYFGLRRYLQAMNRVGVVMLALLAANLVNLAGNWLLIGGNLCLPALGVVGSGWASFGARVALVVILAGYAVWDSIRRRTGLLQTPLRVEPARLARLAALGLPAAGHLLLEVGVFGAAAVLAGRLGETALAAHEVVLHIASVTFMVPLGISSAGAVRVGQAIGRGDVRGASRSGWTALAIASGFMAASGLTLFLVPMPILRVFTPDRTVIAAALPLLGAAALFQLFDGVQVVATGALRGAGDTRSPMIVGFGAYWIIGLPVGYGLGFGLRWGVVGIWVGLALGLIFAGMFLLMSWARTVRRLARGSTVPSPRVQPEYVAAP